MSKRRNHDATFKYEEGQKMVWETIFPTIGVAVAALKGERSVSELATAYEVHLSPAGVCMQTPRGDDDPSMEEGAAGRGRWYF